MYLEFICTRCNMSLGTNKLDPWEHRQDTHDEEMIKKMDMHTNLYHHEGFMSVERQDDFDLPPAQRMIPEQVIGLPGKEVA